MEISLDTLLPIFFIWLKFAYYIEVLAYYKVLWSNMRSWGQNRSPIQFGQLGDPLQGENRSVQFFNKTHFYFSVGVQALQKSEKWYLQILTNFWIIKF